MSEPRSRRWLLRAGALGAATVAGLAHALAWTRSLVPNVLQEPPTRRRLGSPARFPEGTTFLADENLFVVRQGELLRALSAVCTHLGCTVARQEQGFHCPCHGSTFDEHGGNTGGPAPRPLPWRPLVLRGGAVIVDLVGEVGPDAALSAPLPAAPPDEGAKGRPQ